ncbi:bifunctional adenosylcobinamide kinase/adenosylcobinamide-phosphate guanylyltransferase [Paraglaciecola sp.]|uniref:bifunctional adenosylcobinamide kinase/adenosylcobinamide-phosphate guanylyltransferase n=1 Tax=Paraglaciecola sp. TaxID=1920173 RepID=UPI0030F411E8
MIHLILGGARSGKSNFALQKALELSQSKQQNVTYVATATAIDPEMAARISRHQQERPRDWLLAEIPLDLTAFVSQHQGSILLIDCLTLWLNNQLYHYPEQDFAGLFTGLCNVLKNSQVDIILVANEVGLGVIPMGAISRQFVDQAGWLNQAIARCADKVTLVAAGLPLILKGGNK